MNVHYLTSVHLINKHGAIVETDIFNALSPSALQAEDELLEFTLGRVLTSSSQSFKDVFTQKFNETYLMDSKPVDVIETLRSEISSVEEVVSLYNESAYELDLPQITHHCKPLPEQSLISAFAQCNAIEVDEQHFIRHFNFERDESDGTYSLSASTIVDWSQVDYWFSHEELIAATFNPMQKTWSIANTTITPFTVTAH
ncbi:hypothetical protein [Vibrio mediterranei]|uniref:hypothetical protein n=1 Tax=Vibrio mediterranei TaxID=689 RepID=UPI0040692114